MAFSKNSAPRLGDVIAIPFNAHVATGKIIWISDRYKDSFGFAVLPKLFSIEEGVEVVEDAYLPIKIFSGVVNVLYGDIKNVINGNWAVIGHLPLTEIDSKLICHNIGGSLYQGDIFIRELESSEIPAYPKYLSAGNKAIENILSSGFSLN